MNERHDKALTDQLYAKPPASDLDGKNVKHSTKLGELEADRQHEAMVRLWNRMRGLFGQQWAREYGDVDDDQILIWLDALGELSLEQMKI